MPRTLIRSFAVLIVGLIYSTLAAALTYHEDCKQNGGTATCSPFTNNGWRYGPVGESYGCWVGNQQVGGTFAPISGQENDLDTLVGDYVRAMNEHRDEIDAVCSGPQPRMQPASCGGNPTFWDGALPNPFSLPNEHGNVRTCNCLIPDGVRETEHAPTFTMTHPYCSPADTQFLPSSNGSCAGPNGGGPPYFCLRWEDPKNLGNPSCGSSSGNPINTATGNKYQLETDYIGPGPFPLKLLRHYNSGFVGLRSPFGTGWRGEYQRSIAADGSGTVPIATAARSDGKVTTFRLIASVYQGDPDIPDRLIRDADGNGQVTGWRYLTAADETETYDATGKLLQMADRYGNTQSLQYDVRGRVASVTDSVGRQLSFGYDALDHVTSATDTTGRSYTFQYDSLQQLTSVSYPDNSVRTYLYNEPQYTGNANLANTLTGINDENGNRFAIFRYGSDRKAKSTSHVAATGVEVDTYQLTYAQNSTTVIDPLGTSRVYGFETTFGLPKNTSVNQPCSVSFPVK